MRTVALIAFGALWVLLVARALGYGILKALDLQTTKKERRVLGFLLGAAALSTIVFLLACAGMLYSYVFLVIGIIIIAIQRWWWGDPDTTPIPLESTPAPIQATYWIVCTVFGAVYLAIAFAPEISSDGTAYHVGWIARYYDHHGFLRVTTDMYANLPAAVELLYLFAYAFGRHSATAVVHLLFLAALTGCITAYANRIHQGAAGRIAAVLVFVAPVVGRDAASAYNDVAAAAFVFGTFLTLQTWSGNRNDRMLIATGILAGACFATKYTVGVAVIYAVGFVMITCLRSKTPPWRQILLVIGAAAVIMAPWLIKNTVWMGNPLFPFFNQWFPNPYIYESVENDYRAGLAKFNDVTLPEVPLEVTLNGLRLTGLIGPIFLLSPLALFSARSRPGKQLLLGFCVFLIPYFANIGTRFLIPCLPFLALAMAMQLGRPAAIGAVIMWLHAVASWPAMIPLYASPHAWRIEQVPWRAALRLESEHEFLNRRFPEYRAGLMLDEHVPPGGRIYAPPLRQLAYHHRELIGEYGSALGKQTFDMLVSVIYADIRPEWIREYRFSPVRTSQIRLRQTGRGRLEWRVHEVWLYAGGREIERMVEQWTLRATANPWEAGLAFDNTPVSFWRSGRYVEPGMTIEVRLGTATEVDTIRMLQPLSQQTLGSPPDAFVNGTWVPLKAAEQWTHIGKPRHMRRRVMDELKFNGIGWLLLREEDYCAADIAERRQQWGVTLVAEVDGFRLWRID